MVKMIDIKSAGLSQDLKELKYSKSKKESGYYNQAFEKAKLSLARSSYNVKYNPSISKEEKERALKYIQTEKQKLSERESIDKQKQKVYEHSFGGRVEKGVNRLVEKGYKALQGRVISRGIVKQSKAILVLKEKPKDVYVPIYFKAEINEAKKSAFFDD